MLFNAEGTYVHNAAKKAMGQFLKDFKEVETKLLEDERKDRADENHCCLCGGARFNFEPPVFYCNGKRVDAMHESDCVHEWTREGIGCSFARSIVFILPPSLFSRMHHEHASSHSLSTLAHRALPNAYPSQLALPLRQGQQVSLLHQVLGQNGPDCSHQPGRRCQENHTQSQFQKEKER